MFYVLTFYTVSLCVFPLEVGIIRMKLCAVCCSLSQTVFVCVFCHIMHGSDYDGTVIIREHSFLQKNSVKSA